MLLRVADLFVARHAPLADGRDDLHVGRERLYRHIEAHLVVALAGAAMRHITGAFLARVIHQQLGDEWPRQRRGQRIDVLVQRARLERREHELTYELLFRVGNEGLDCASAQRLLPHNLEIFLVPDVDRDGDHVQVVLLVDPADCN